MDVVPRPKWLLLVYVVLFRISTNVHGRDILNQEQKVVPSPPSSVSAIFVFGDSSVDTGNNNYLPYTTSKGNKPPYGRDFVNHTPTGRFSNGRLIPDFLASYLGVKEFVPPYLDPTLSTEELMTGVCFASASTGYDPLTAQFSNVISMPKQLEYFKEYKTKLEKKIGKDRVQDIIKKALFIVSCGDNDFVINYFVLPIRRQNYTTPVSYEEFVLRNAKEFIQGLLDEGARKIAVAGVAPMGCFPAVINLNSKDPFHNRDCIERLTSVSVDYNTKLQEELKSIQNNAASPGTSIAYVDIYTPLIKMVEEPGKFAMAPATENFRANICFVPCLVVQTYGICMLTTPTMLNIVETITTRMYTRARLLGARYEDVNSGCCGAGPLKVSFSCNLKSYVCPDPSKYVYWDAIHPTERAYYLIFKSILPVLNEILH